MEVKLLKSYSELADMEYIATEAALTCHGNADKLDEKDFKQVLTNIIKLGHESILEHITLSFRVQDISRALLQELSRHRHISLSVESTRHTLKKKMQDKKWIENFLTSLDYQKSVAFQAFIGIYEALQDRPEDEIKYFIPEFFPTRLILTVNARELRHILKLRTHPSALMEFRELGVALFEAIPDDFKYLFEDCVYKDEK